MLLSLYQRSDSRSPPLRVGLLLDSTTLPRWAAEVIEHITQCDFASLELLVFNAEPREQSPTRSRAGKIAHILQTPNLRRSVLYSLYQRWDSGRVDSSIDPFVPVDCTTQLAGIESISVVPHRNRFVHRFPQEALHLIREKKLDVLLRFGFNILRGDILTAARCGVWSYHHGDDNAYRGGPAHFWEVVEQNPLSGVMLQVLTEELDAGTVLCKGLFATYPGISRARNCIQPYLGATTFVIQKLHELHQRGWDCVRAKALPAAPYLGRKPIYRTPTNVEMLRWLGPIAASRIAQRWRQPTIHHWHLAIRTGKPLSPEGQLDAKGFRTITSPRGRFYADPFLVNEDGATWVFFEDFDYAADCGRISCAEVRDGELGPVIPILERPYHLSYPCLFRDAGELYMIPESGAHGTVELYRCKRFPDQWEFVKVLFHGRAVDTTIHIADGLYWFFTTLQEARGDAIQLWLFYATELTGEWIPHPANPISTDVRYSRGAGAIICSGGKRFRPAQDCSQHYGYRFTFQEIVTLDCERYVERPAAAVNPDWAPGLVATHTYSHTGNVEIIDGCTPLPNARVL